jgi:hypothetical protein
MNKNAQILIGVGVLAVGGYLYWKSTQTPSTTTAKANATGGGKKKKKNADGSTKTLSTDFFDVRSSKNAQHNFKNADGIFANASGDKIFANADGIFANAAGTQGAVQTPPIIKQNTIFAPTKSNTKNADGRIFANASGDKIFANMVQPVATYNTGFTFM